MTRTTRTPSVAWLFVCILLPTTIEAQERTPVPSSCISCEPREAVPLLAPGTVDARRAMFEPLERFRADSLVALGPPAPQEASLPGCGTLALVTGAVAAVAGVLLVVVLDSAVPLEDDTSATSRYLIAGGIGFGVGAAYAFLRCRINRPSSRSHYAATTGLTHEGQ